MIFISKLFQFYRDKQFYWWIGGFTVEG